jgi:AcrR family transcriptional regulator
MFASSNTVHPSGAEAGSSPLPFGPPPGTPRNGQAQPPVAGSPETRAGQSPAGREERRNQRLRQTRDHILQAARQVMLEAGSAHLSLREVARRANFSPAALYKYFASRDEIVAELTTESFRRLRASLRDVPATLPTDERLIQLGLAYMRFADENPADLRCILALAATERPTETGQSYVVGTEIAQLLGETLREGVRAGIFRPLSQADLTRTAFACWSLVHGMVALAGVDLSPVSDQVRSDPEGVLRDFVASLRTGAAGGCSTPST